MGESHRSGRWVYARSSFCTLNFGIHTALQHHPDHFVVAHERPQRILKSCRLVFLDEEVTDPCRAVSRDQRQRKEPPLADDDKVNNAAERDGSADEMQQTRAGMAVFPNVVGPEFRE